MSTDLECMLRAGLREYADAPYVVTPPLTVPPSTVAARHRRRSGWLAPLVAAAAVLALFATIAFLPLGTPSSSPTGASSGLPSVPGRFAGYSRLTAQVSNAPPGRAIAAYQYAPVDSLLDSVQSLVVGADRAAYRQLGRPPWDTSFWWTSSGSLAIDQPHPVLLSPDGTRLAHVEGGNQPHSLISVLDLTTGRLTTYPTPAEAAPVTVLAWSADGRRLAYLWNPVDPLVTAELRVLDLDSRASITLGGTKVEASTVAVFSPDGASLAFQEGPGQPIRILNAATLTTRRQFAVPGGRSLAGQAAWSPDGRLLALFEGDPTRQDRPTRISVVEAATGTAPQNAVAVTASVVAFLGWRSAGVLLYQRSGQANPVIAQILVAGGRSEVVATFPDEAGNDRHLASVQLAYGLTTTMTVRPADDDPDHGPWPAWACGLLASAVLLAAGVGWLLWRIRRNPS